MSTRTPAIPEASGSGKAAALPVTGITSPNLRTVTRSLDKAAQIQNFIESQKHHRKAYATEGRAILVSWAQGQRTPERKGTTSEHGPIGDFGFGTPVLKARIHKREEEKVNLRNLDLAEKVERSFKPLKDNNIKYPEQAVAVPKPKAKDIIVLKRKQTQTINSIQSSSDIVHTDAKCILPETKKSTRTLKQKDKTNLPSSQEVCLVKQLKPKVSSKLPNTDKPGANGKSNSNKRPRREEIDDEREARLEERRERKRTKKAITQPTEVEPESDPEDKKIDEAFKRSRTKKGRTGNQKSAKPKIQAGLAMMQGWTAPNVADHRLTLKPIQAIGVFGRGKASVNIKTRRKKTATKNNRFISKIFSEFEFLHANRISASGSAISSAVSPEERSSENDERKSTPPKLKEHRTFIFSDDGCENPSNSENHNTNDDHATQQIQKKRREEYDPAESEVWDIELDSIVTRTDDNIKEPTVVLPARSSWGDHEVTPIPLAEHQSPLMIQREEIDRPSSSLCPSQSASQYGLPRSSRELLTLSTPIRNHARMTHSKYFPPSHATETAETQTQKGSIRFVDDQVDPLDDTTRFQDSQPLTVDQFPLANYHESLEQTNASVLSLSDPSVPNQMDTCLHNASHDACNTELSAYSSSPLDFEMNDYDIYDIEYPKHYRGYSELSIFEHDGMVERAADEDQAESITYTEGFGHEAGHDTVAHRDIDADEDVMWHESLTDAMLERNNASEMEIPASLTCSGTLENSSSINDPCFSEGRALLMGYAGEGLGPVARDAVPQRIVSQVEMDVIRGLRQHWRPQKL